MPLSWKDIQSNALAFSKQWKDATDESADAQSFLNDFFGVFGIDRKRVGTFETKVPIGDRRFGYIDLLWKGVILIEMKSVGKSLDKAYAQAKDYAFHLEDEDLPDYIMVSDFQNIRLYRLSTNQVWNIKTSQLHKNVKLFADLAGYKASTVTNISKEVDVKAAEKMARLHDILRDHGYIGHALEVYLVRLLFCLFADDTGIFEKNIFFDYINNSKEDGSDLSARMARLFELLDTSQVERDKQTMLPEELKRFAYIDGTLFEERLPFADFNQKMRQILLECCAFDWGYISPAIFGAMFQGVMNPEERRALGAHYTSEENIMKVIKPLFLDELWEEFERIKGNSKQLEYFHEKLSNLTFLDPACGCGNFLIIAYKELRLLELEVLKMLIDTGGQQIMDIQYHCKINVDQFYGIECEEFPCQIAVVGMWLIDHQMNTLVSEYFGQYFARLPLEHSATIVNGNALRIDWEHVVPKNQLNYILGNPPFVGARLMNTQQKDDIAEVFGTVKGFNNLDYVTAWYFKAAKFINLTTIEVAFVSTNSISQGLQVPILWRPLTEQYAIDIRFAYRTFRWDNEAKGKAAVHCVIVGFRAYTDSRIKKLFTQDDGFIAASNINPYLVEAPNIFIESRKIAISNVPQMYFGSMPNDGGHLLLSEEDKKEILAECPIAEKYIKKFMGANEYINNIKRWCLWLVDLQPGELRSLPLIKDRVEKVQTYRNKSNRAATKQLALTPTLFGEIRQPDSDYLIIPCHSSEKRRYIPIGFIERTVIANNSTLIIPNADLYHFGILTSKVHMAWMRAVCGRLKSDYRYSKDLVYNNFPWPEPTDKQKESIETAAQLVLDARALFPESSLADLYDPLTMPPELTKAHNNLDRAVVAAYGGPGFTTEAERVADLMKRHQSFVTVTEKRNHLTESTVSENE
jgi:hypothetical protein